MACSSCGKRRSASSIKAAQSARAAGVASLSPGLSSQNPYLLGLDTSDEYTSEFPLRVRVVRGIERLKAAQAAWVYGDEVAAHIERGNLIDISRTTQARRLWKVGKYTYSNETEARRAASVLNQTAVEIA